MLKTYLSKYEFFVKKMVIAIQKFSLAHGFTGEEIYIKYT
jgi:hypothetical protein